LAEQLLQSDTSGSRRKSLTNSAEEAKNMSTSMPASRLQPDLTPELRRWIRVLGRTSGPACRVHA
jgi:hypothetical protein